MSNKNKKQVAGKMLSGTTIEGVCAEYGITKVYAAYIFYTVTGIVWTAQ